ncbi:MAG TPA: DUF6298 domain-containing protein [Bacteroidales bacterium]|nr:DUF6298 domain-containing protein [Bacteroidales bacterium]
MKSKVLIFLFAIGFFLISCNKVEHNPLKVSTINPRYFTDASGKAIYLTGSHTWNNLVDMIEENNPAPFDYKAYLDFLKGYNHNFYRLWSWELLNWDTNANKDKKPENYKINPHPWLRSGPGIAIDGEPAFDLTKFNESYFERLRERVEKAQKYGFYVSIMLFEGWGIQFSPDAYSKHPFYPMNNINNLGLDTAETARLEIHELKHRRVVEIQEIYVKKVLETVNDLDNVLCEISNENHPLSTEWQYHMIRFIKDYEKLLGNQHPVGMTFQYKGGSNQVLFDSPADWISPNNADGYRDNPPASDGRKVIITDTDHLWGIGGNIDWVWKSFLRGMNILFMDPYNGSVLFQDDLDWAKSMCKNLGYTRHFADKVDLINMVPSGNLSSTNYCLANIGKEYIVYLPTDTTASLDLKDVSGKFKVEWFDPSSGASVEREDVQGGSDHLFNSPFHSGSAVLYLKKE